MARQKKRKYFWIFLLLLVLFFYSHILAVLGGVLKFVTYPIWVTKNEITEQLINPASFLVSKKQLLISNRQLKKDILEAEMMLADRNNLLKENIELKEILGRVRAPGDLILATVLVKPNVSVYDSLIVDAGKNLDIKRGNKVFAFGNIVIGEVDKVESKMSKVRLYSSAQTQTNVSVGLYNIPAVAIGRGGGDFEIKLPKELNIEEGDPVTIPNINSFVIGSVVMISTSPTDSFQTLLVKSKINLFELRWVGISKDITTKNETE